MMLPAKLKILEHPARTAVAATISLLVARQFKLPEAYWAAVTTLVVMQSTLGAALTTSAQRLAGTALGAATGGLVASRFPGNLPVFALSIFLLGILCAAVGLGRNAYRFAGITLTIIMLVLHEKSAWVVAIHRFIEVSIGIAVGLVVTAVWPESKSVELGKI